MLLPDSYLASAVGARYPALLPPSSARADAQRAAVRARHGLPAGAAVLACFNRALKMDSATFAAWAAVLRKAPPRPRAGPAARVTSDGDETCPVSTGGGGWGALRGPSTICMVGCPLRHG